MDMRRAGSPARLLRPAPAGESRVDDGTAPPVLRREQGAIRRNFTRTRWSLLQLVARYRSDRSARIIVHAVILIELLLIALFLALNALDYLVVGYALPRDSMLRLDLDRGYPEMFNYAVSAVTVVPLVRISVLTKQPVYAAWALVFSYVPADDAASIHESGGRLFERHFAGPTVPGLRLNDTGELLT